MERNSKWEAVSAGSDVRKEVDRRKIEKGRLRKRRKEKRGRREERGK